MYEKGREKWENLRNRWIKSKGATSGSLIQRSGFLWKRKSKRSAWMRSQKKPVWDVPHCSAVTTIRRSWLLRSAHRNGRLIWTSWMRQDQSLRYTIFRPSEDLFLRWTVISACIRTIRICCSNYITHQTVRQEELANFHASLNSVDTRLHMMYAKAKEDKTFRTDIPEEQFMRVTVHTMMAACTHYAGGFIWGATDNKDYTGDLLLLKEMILNYARNDANL